MTHNKIGKKLFKKIFGWYIVVAVILSLFQLFTEYRYAKNQLLDELNFLSKAFYEPLYNSVWNLDEEQIQANVDAINSLDSIYGISIIDTDNNILAKKGIVQDKAQQKDDLILNSFDLVYTDGNDKEKLATVNIYSSSNVIFSRLENSVMMIIIIAIIKSTILLFLFLFFTKKILSRPLDRLIKATDSITPSHYEVIELKEANSTDELTKLIQAYNNMGGRLTYLFDEVVNVKNKLEEEHRYLQAIVNSVNNPIMIVKDDYTVKLMNHDVCKHMKDVPFADPKNPKCYEITHSRTSPCEDDGNICPLKAVQKSFERTVVIHEVVCEDGKRFMEITATPLFDNKKNYIGIIKSANDITEKINIENELQEQKKELNFRKNYDHLTNLPNRILFHEYLETNIKEARLNAEKFALFFIDLDRFKQINDSFGHEVGDVILKVVVQRLKSQLPSIESLARIGSDEFVLVRKNFMDIDDIAHSARLALDLIAKPIDVQGQTFYVTASIGISLYPRDEEDSYILLKYADTAMNKAKNEGRNNFQFYSSEMTELIFEKVKLESALREAMLNEELSVYYQPQIDAANNKVSGSEALVRWIHPVLGFIAPNKFIPLAEETGLIIDIDRYVMRAAMGEHMNLRHQGIDPGILSLNLASKNLASDDYIELLKEYIKEFGFKPYWLILEVTESDIMNKPLEAIERLQILSDMGIQIAIDDFGTGYSSLAYLKKFPIHKLKIDRSFIKDTPDSNDDVAIVKTIISLAHNLNLDVIAEGVETYEQKEFLLKYGCSNIQGFYYSKAIDIQSFENYLTTMDKQ